MAGELGYYRQAGIRVRLTREVGWASVLNKVVLGQLDAAHAIGTLPIAATLGLAGRACPCGTGLVLNSGGNGISLAASVRRRGVESAEEFRQEVRSSRWARTYTLGVVSGISTHRYTLLRWLEGLRLEPGKDVRVVTVPPGQALRNLSAGTIDGFCVGDPWHSLAARRGIGWTVALGEDLFPRAPEKVLMVTRRFAEQQSQEHIALVAAVLRAAEYCHQPEHAEHVADTLSRSSFLGIDRAVLLDIFQGRYDDGVGGVRTFEHLIHFAPDLVGRPDRAVGEFFLKALEVSTGGDAAQWAEQAAPVDIFWEDVFHEARSAAKALS